jgi:hypothetical protein
VAYATHLVNLVLAQIKIIVFLVIQNNILNPILKPAYPIALSYTLSVLQITIVLSKYLNKFQSKKNTNKQNCLLSLHQLKYILEINITLLRYIFNIY